MSVLDAAIEWLDKAYDKASDQVGDWSEAWQRQVDTFKTKAREFLSLYVELKERAGEVGADPELKAEYDSWMSRADIIRRTIEEIANKLDWSINTFLGGNGNAMGNLGAPVLIPVAVIAAAIATLSVALSSGYKVKRRMDAVKELSEQGRHDLARAVAQGRTLIPGGIGSIFWLGLVGATLYYAFSDKGIKRMLEK